MLQGTTINRKGDVDTMKKFLTLALALLMVCMMLPVVAMAEEGAEGAGVSSGPVEYWAGFTADTKKESFATLEEAFAYAQATEQGKRREPSCCDCCK